MISNFYCSCQSSTRVEGWFIAKEKKYMFSMYTFANLTKSHQKIFFWDQKKDLFRFITMYVFKITHKLYIFLLSDRLGLQSLSMTKRFLTLKYTHSGILFMSCLEHRDRNRWQHLINYPLHWTMLNQFTLLPRSKLPEMFC